MSLGGYGPPKMDMTHAGVRLSCSFAMPEATN